uniref:Glycosyltransferase family 92 protein n=1 Tax=Panagrellus redivivus TaxID=6233 RepID=A0A7E4UZC6_PANRE
MLTSLARIAPATYRSMCCRWTVFIARCFVLPNVFSFGIKAAYNDQVISIPIEKPEQKQRGIVACFLSMYFEQRWQLITTTHELYVAWGVDLQVDYVHSASTDLLRLLRSFVEKGFVEIRSFDITDPDNHTISKLGYPKVCVL